MGWEGAATTGIWEENTDLSSARDRVSGTVVCIPLNANPHLITPNEALCLQALFSAVRQELQLLVLQLKPTLAIT